MRMCTYAGAVRWSTRAMRMRRPGPRNRGATCRGTAGVRAMLQEDPESGARGPVTRAGVTGEALA
eukprot:10579567-Alexandrium_andersonii.AAC.1